MSNAPMIINEVEINLSVKENKVFINSLDLAKVFNKNHKDVLETAKKQPQNEFTESNFILSTYKDKKGELRPCYNLTRDGFSLLVMGFTGEKAYKWKIEFIKAFNEMEKRLKNLEKEQMQKLAFKQSLGYKSQLKQQKEKYENKIKALKYDLDKLKNTQNFKRKLNHKELQELKKFLAKEYDIFTLNKCFFGLFAESVSRKNYTLDKENGFCIYKSIEEKLNSWLDYDKHYDENEKRNKIIK